MKYLMKFHDASAHVTSAKVKNVVRYNGAANICVASQFVLYKLRTSTLLWLTISVSHVIFNRKS
jgi:hypothetical protein